jgi:PleD family two-component response regulator
MERIFIGQSTQDRGRFTTRAMTTGTVTEVETDCAPLWLRCGESVALTPQVDPVQHASDSALRCARVRPNGSAKLLRSMASAPCRPMIGGARASPLQPEVLLRTALAFAAELSCFAFTTRLQAQQVPDFQPEWDLSLEESRSAAPEEVSRLLVVGSEHWWTRSIQSIFEPFNYEIFAASSGERAVQHQRVSSPEAVIVHARVDDGFGVDLVRRLRLAGLRREHPVILVSEEPLRREERLDAFRAGVWDCLSAPLNGEELLLKLESYMSATRVATRARQQVLLDEASGLYNAQGILRWARELGHAARRYNRAFGCAVFTPVAASSATATTDSPSDPGAGESSRAIANRLSAQGRTSDIIGRLSPNEYVVLATDTGPEGILTMASRFVAGGETEADDASPDLVLRAGCYAVSDLGVQQVEPEELITRATLALRRAEIKTRVAFYVN